MCHKKTVEYPIAAILIEKYKRIVVSGRGRDFALIREVALELRHLGLPKIQSIPIENYIDKLIIW